MLTQPLTISGQPIAHLIASTTGTDSDWVVKLIDVYPDEVAGQPELGGYQLPVSMDIFRGRYREDLAVAKPIAANKPLLYKFAMPTANHVFLPGHKIMVQVQSSWFPLYDRNPQTFVPNIFFAKPDDLQARHATRLPLRRRRQLHRTPDPRQRSSHNAVSRCLALPSVIPKGICRTAAASSSRPERMQWRDPASTSLRHKRQHTTPSLMDNRNRQPLASCTCRKT